MPTPRRKQRYTDYVLGGGGRAGRQLTPKERAARRQAERRTGEAAREAQRERGYTTDSALDREALTERNAAIMRASGLREDEVRRVLEWGTPPPPEPRPPVSRERTCEVCGREFTATANPRRRTCSRSCADQLTTRSKRRASRRQRAVELRRQGKTQREIANALGVSQPAVSGWLRSGE